MSSLEWNDELKLELLRLKAEITPQSLRVLSGGLGLGKVEKVEVKNPIFGELTRSAIPQTNSISYMGTKPPIAMALKPQKDVDPGMPSCQDRNPVIRNGRHWTFFLSSHFLDIAFILFSILVGVIFLGLVFDFEGLVSGYWLEWLPFQVLSNLGYGFLPIALYGLFGIYFLFFRIFLGKTLGESIIFSNSGKSKELSRRS